MRKNIAKGNGHIVRRRPSLRPPISDGCPQHVTGPRATTPVDKGNLDMIKRVRLFQSLREGELCEVLPKLVFKEFRKNQTILQERDVNEFMYIIVRGKVKISQTSEEGREMILTLHNAGEFFGEMSLIDGATTPATVAALEPSTVAIISRNEFYNMLLSEKKVLYNLLNMLCTRLRDAWKTIQMLNFRNASDRVKMLLLMLAENAGEKTEKGTILGVKLIHQDIADMTGLTRETVTRVLDKWRKSGEIRVLNDKRIFLTPEFETISL